MSEDDYERIAEQARALARRHLEEARTEGLQLPGDVDLLVDREAARILRNVAQVIDSDADAMSDDPARA